MSRYFLHSCSKIQARREKDLTSEMRLNSAKNVRLKKRDGGKNFQRCSSWLSQFSLRHGCLPLAKVSVCQVRAIRFACCLILPVRLTFSGASAYLFQCKCDKQCMLIYISYFSTASFSYDDCWPVSLIFPIITFIYACERSRTKVTIRICKRWWTK